MRLLLLSNLYPPQVLGGFELSCARIAEGLRARGHEVRVLTTPTFLPAGDAPAPTVELHRTLSLRTYFPLPRTGGEIARLMHHESSVGRFENTRILLDELRDFEPDHVVAFNLVGLGGIALIDLLKTVGAPWTMNLGDRVPNTLVDGIPAEVLSVYGADRADYFESGNIVTVTRALADSIEAGGLSLGEVEVMGRGVMTDGPVREREYRVDGVTRFVFAGSLGEHKGVGLILEAAARVAAESTAFTIDLFGGGDVDGWKQRADALGVSESVRFRGSVPHAQVLAANAASDVFLFPTWSEEPLGIAPIEAAAAGCVPIVTATSGVAEFLVHGSDAIKIPRTVDALAEAMLAVVTGETDLAPIGRRGQEHARGPLGFDRSLDLIETNLARVARPGWTEGGLHDGAVETGIMDRDHRAIDILHHQIANPGEHHGL